MWKKTLALMSLMLLNGCVGIVDKTSQINTVCTNDCRFSNGFGGKYISNISNGHLSDTDKVTKQNVETYWRKPDEILSIGTHERWVFKESVWTGYVPLVIVPVPLILPLGESETVITFDENGVVDTVDQKMLVETGGLCLAFKIVDTTDHCFNLYEPIYPVFNN